MSDPEHKPHRRKARNPNARMYEYLGRICASWSIVETHLGALLAFMMESNPSYMFVITESVAGATITNWVRILCETQITDHSIKTKMQSLLKEVTDIRSERNSLVHGLWEAGPETDTALVQTVRMDRNEILKEVLFTPADFDEILDRIHRVGVTFDRIGRQLGYYQ